MQRTGVYCPAPVAVILIKRCSYGITNSGGHNAKYRLCESIGCGMRERDGRSKANHASACATRSYLQLTRRPRKLTSTSLRKSSTYRDLRSASTRTAPSSGSDLSTTNGGRKAAALATLQHASTLGVLRFQSLHPFHSNNSFVSIRSSTRKCQDPNPHPRLSTLRPPRAARLSFFRVNGTRAPLKPSREAAAQACFR